MSETLTNIEESSLRIAKVLNVQDAIFMARENLMSITSLKLSGIFGVSKEDDGWKVTIELIERKAIPDTSDILGIYEMKLNDKGEIVTFNRIKLRRRGDT